MNYKEAELSSVLLFPDLHTYSLHTIQKSLCCPNIIFFLSMAREETTITFILVMRFCYTGVLMPVALEYNLLAFIYEKWQCLGTLEWQTFPPMHQALPKLLQPTILLGMVLSKLLTKTLRISSQVSNQRNII